MKDLAFPAHAGMNRPATSSAKAPLRLPRARGDEPNFPNLEIITVPPSPRTRG